jgi:hypothetical protein
MIERCTFCGETHETGGEDTIDGKPFKMCPTIPDNVGGYFFNPKEWIRDLPTHSDTGMRCLVDHGLKGQCKQCSCGVLVPCDEWKEHIENR